MNGNERQSKKIKFDTYDISHLIKFPYFKSNEGDVKKRSKVK